MALRILTWSVLGFEILFAPLALIRAVRPWIWAAMFAMHCGLILLIDFADLSLGMIVIHLFVFDQRWLYSLSAYPFTRLSQRHLGQRKQEFRRPPASCQRIGENVAYR